MEMNLRDDCSNPCSHLSRSHVELQTSDQFIFLVRESRPSRGDTCLAGLGPKTPWLNLQSRLASKVWPPTFTSSSSELLVLSFRLPGFFCSGSESEEEASLPAGGARMAGLAAGEGVATSSSVSDSDEEEEEGCLTGAGAAIGAGAGGGDVGRVSSSSTSTPSSSSTMGWTGAGGLSTGADSSSLADEDEEEEEEGAGEAGLSEERWST